MKIRKKKQKQRLPVQVVETGTEQNSYQKFLWTCSMAVIFLAGNLQAFFAIYDEIKISRMLIVFTAVIGMILAMGSQYVAKKMSWIYILRAIPLVILLILSPFACWEGMRMWLNQIIIGWNRLHQSALVLFAGSSTVHTAESFGVVASMIFGEIVWIMIEKRKILICSIYGLLWILLMLIGDHFSAISVAFFIVAIFGVAMFRQYMHIRKSGVINFIVILFICIIGAILMSNGNLRSIKETRENIAHNIHELRYGKDQLPEGKLDQASKLHKSKQNMMKVTSQEKKTLYLRAYVGADYQNGTWKKTPNSVYGGENAGLIRWLKNKNFDPLKQSALYQELNDEKNNLSKNHVKIQIEHASRYYFYTPDSLKTIIDGSAKSKMDSNMLSKGIWGQNQYEWTEISSARPSELTVAGDWITNPKNAAQKQYSEAEAVYRKFVYDNYTKVDENLVPLINRIFWKDYDSKSDGIYSALNQVRTKLREQCTYTKTPAKTPKGEDPIEWFLTKSHSGNQMLYASAAVEAFRVHGIPARYVEGYYLGASKISGSKDGVVTLTGENAHAWVEVYFDGVGWKAVDVTPGFYYNVARLQKMVNTPDKVKKNAALRKNGYKGKSTTDSGKQNKDIGKKVKKTVKNIAMILLGMVACVIIVLVILFAFIEIRFFIIEKQRIRRYENADMKERVKILSKEIFGILTILGFEAKLGWKTEETDQMLSIQFETVNKGDYQRASALMEKTIYGGITLELFEERTVKMFRDKLKMAIDSSGWKEKLKVKYQYKKYCM